MARRPQKKVAYHCCSQMTSWTWMPCLEAGSEIGHRISPSRAVSTRLSGRCQGSLLSVLATTIQRRHHPCQLARSEVPHLPRRLEVEPSRRLSQRFFLISSQMMMLQPVGFLWWATVSAEKFPPPLPQDHSVQTEKNLSATIPVPITVDLHPNCSVQYPSYRHCLATFPSS